METKEAFSGKESSPDYGISPVQHGGSVSSQGQWGGKYVMLSVLKQNGRCINSLATESKIKARAVQGLIQTKDCLQSCGCFPTEDERKKR